MSLLWPELVDNRTPAPIDRQMTDDERVRFENDNLQYNAAKNAWMFGIAARLGAVALVGGYIIYSAVKPRRRSPR